MVASRGCAKALCRRRLSLPLALPLAMPAYSPRIECPLRGGFAWPTVAREWARHTELGEFTPAPFTTEGRWVRLASSHYIGAYENAPSDGARGVTGSAVVDSGYVQVDDQF